ncbi:putative bifunctional diguanylate cyclase/phosphodiesterase [Aidingimonas lacisalsi]|uniref:putative bifunctional diguanylate cyclase/phosphodiesterase n=1 Tax=Aidingimonas lacisalsi TaxID=2604086 RepID=UPI0013761F17|nr:GGDEF and EAL domain-containing protein [Aidingimonas lacisalsi]
MDKWRSMSHRYRRHGYWWYGISSVAIVLILVALWTRWPWLLLIPLLLIGGLSAWSFKRFSRQSQAGLAIINEMLDTQQRLADQQQAWRELRELHQQNVSETHFFNVLLQSTSQLVDAESLSIWLLDEGSNVMSCHASLTPKLIGESLDTRQISDYMQALQNAPSLTADDAPKDPRLQELSHYLQTFGIASMLDVGIFVGGELRGILCCESQQPRQWRAEDVSCLMAVSGLLSQFSESLRRQAAERDLYRQIHYDEVTHLPTLRGLDASLEHYLSKGSFHLGVLRIGGLSHVNETLGQPAGDEALYQVATELRRWVHQCGSSLEMARLPSNRIVILIPAKSRSHLQTSGIDLLTTLNAHSWVGDRHPVSLQFAMGIASYPDDSRNTDQLLQRAELALKKARADTRHFLAFYNSELSEWQREHNRLERELRDALNDAQFRLYLQPQFNVHGELRGAEALIRWQHPRQGLLSPGDFIGVAERSGLIRPIGYWVLEQAAILLAGPLKHSAMRLSVNVSVHQLRDDDFAARTASLLQEYQLAPQRLVLEVVESLLVTPGVANKLQALRRLGIKLSLDDFGTGYSSLRYLQEFQVDEIKLDKVFIDPLQQQDDVPLARSIIAMGKALGLHLVAEGVEKPCQLEFLETYHVDLIQGYYLARPESIAAFQERLTNRLTE